MGNEPVRVAAVVVAALTFAAALGLNISEDQIVEVGAALSTLIVIVGEVVRSKVSPVEK